MIRNVTACFALTALCALTAGAQAQATPPIAAFAIADGLTVHKSALSVPISVNVSDAAGLRSASLSGAYSSASSYYVAGTTNATLQISFFVSYFPVGDYKFRSTVVNTNGVITQKSITLHLVP